MLYIVFHDSATYHAVKVRRCHDDWMVDESGVSGPVKLDFAFFPQGASYVEAHFDSELYAYLEQPGFRAVTDKMRQQCLRFTYKLN